MDIHNQYCSVDLIPDLAKIIFLYAWIFGKRSYYKTSLVMPPWETAPTLIFIFWTSEPFNSDGPPCYMPPWFLEKFGVRGASELNGYDVYNFFNLQSRNTHYSLKTWKFAEEGDSLLKSCDGSWDYRTRRKQNRVHFSGNTLTRFIWGWICFVW